MIEKEPFRISECPFLLETNSYFFEWANKSTTEAKEAYVIQVNLDEVFDFIVLNYTWSKKKF